MMPSSDEVNPLYEQLLQGEYISVLEDSHIRAVVSHVLKLARQEIDGDLSSHSKEALFTAAVGCLQLFVQNNWTGPLIASHDPLHTLLSLTANEYEELNAEALPLLSVDGETAYEGILMPFLLVVCRYIMKELTTTSHDLDKGWLLWQLRSVQVHQAVINERCDSLKSEAIQYVHQLIEKDTGRDNSHFLCSSGEALSVIWRLEAVTLCRQYFEYKLCAQLLNEAVDLSQLDIQTTGVKGKRTRYQEKSIAQLVLAVKRLNSDEQKSTKLIDQSEESMLPKNELLADDTVLEQMELNEASTVEKADLSWTEQCLVLALCEDNKHSKPAADADIVREETAAYLTYILSNPKDWSVQSVSLLRRSLMERHSGRRLGRSLAQLEELSSLNTKNQPSASKRLRAAYTSQLPPIWKLQSCLGELHMELGAFASAMEIFERLALWEPLIVCSQRAGRLGKAEELIRSRLAIKESPPLYCSLADVTGNEEYYLKAWELSNNRSARAMRGLAFHHLRACQYEEAMACFVKTLAINPLQLPCWFSFGCASLAAQNYEQAAQAFRRCVMLEQDNFEAWNNLAAAYARNDQKQRAFLVLQDAIKCNYDNWKVWENYTVIGADCRQISEVIRGAHRILELTGKWQDEQVITLLTKFVTQDLADGDGQPSSKHRDALLKLLGHATSKVTSNGVLWRCYAQLILDSSEQNRDNTERGIQCLQKAYRCSISSSTWEKTEDQCKMATEALLELVDAYLLVPVKKYLGTARLQLNSHISRLKKGHTDPVTKEIQSERINTLLKALNDALVNLPTASD